jgi:hypothetical protein
MIIIETERTHQGFARRGTLREASFPVSLVAFGVSIILFIEYFNPLPNRLSKDAIMVMVVSINVLVSIFNLYVYLKEKKYKDKRVAPQSDL